MSKLTNLVSLLRTSGAALLLLGSGGLACSAPDDGGAVPDAKPGEFADKGGAIGLCDASTTGTPLLRRLTAREFNNTLNSVFPEVAGQWNSLLSPDSVSHYGYDNEVDKLVVTKQMARDLDRTAAAVATSVKSALAAVLPCSQTAPDRACAEQFVAKYGKRLYHRSLSSEESGRVLGLFDEALPKTSFPDAIGWVTRALILSPAAVYRREIGVSQEGKRALSQHEVATALAYTFSGTAPTDDLLAQADAGELNDKQKLKDIAKGLLATPQGRENLHYLFGAWLEYPKVTTVTKTNVTDFEALREEMRAETRRFLEVVVFDGGGGIKELLTSPVTVPSAGLAAFYGFPAPAGDGQPVTRPEGQGVGILAQGSILATEASSNSSSPTQRGLLVMENLMCRTPPIVPANIPIITEPSPGEKTTRQRYEELHASEGGCKQCHKQFDPIGFGFEHYDEAGRYRADEGTLPIDSSGQVPKDGAAEGFPFAGQEELASKLADDREVQACVSGRLKVFAFGSEEGCLGEGERDEFMSGAIGFIDYIASLAAEPHFSQRKPE